MKRSFNFLGFDQEILYPKSIHILMKISLSQYGKFTKNYYKFVSTHNFGQDHKSKDL